MSTGVPPSNFSVIDLAAEAKKAWGPEWNKPEPSYEFSTRFFFNDTATTEIYTD